MKGLLASVKGSPFNKAAYEDAFKCMYDLLRLARRDGMLALEPHISKPEESSIFSKYPKVLHNHHLLHFICGGMGPLIDATVKPEQMAELLEAELKVMEEEHHAPMPALTKMADALPGFGIVAAVLGIVITMGHIDGPPAEIGHKVGAALVGTFLGILLSYGFAAPLATRMEFLAHRRRRVLPHDRVDHRRLCQQPAAEGGDRNGPPRRDQRIPPRARRARRMVQGSGSSVRSDELGVESQEPEKSTLAPELLTPNTYAERHMAGKGGGAWKVAYADFVTAMMAFFLVMWITSQNDDVKKAIGGYFQDPWGTSHEDTSRRA